MADYLLVHGALNDGSVWDQVAAVLRQKGHRVFAPTLTPPQDIGLADNIDEIIRLIEKEKLYRIILVGHSYAGLVITGVADRLPERIASLVYVDSSVPVSGRSLFDLIVSYGIDPKAHQLPDLHPFTDALVFDESRWRKFPKLYIHCLRSEFLDVGVPAAELVKKNAKRANWRYFEVDSKHHCMIEKPKETAGIMLKAS